MSCLPFGQPKNRFFEQLLCSKKYASDETYFSSYLSQKTGILTLKIEKPVDFLDNDLPILTMPRHVFFP
jgi:hypothetical protein